MALLRKDLKIGFLAGALLLVLAVGYALVLTFTGPDATQASPSASADPAPVGQAGPVPSPDEPSSTRGEQPAAEGATLAKSNATSEWDVYGVNGKEPSITSIDEPLPDAPVEDQPPPTPDLNKVEPVDPPGAAQADAAAPGNLGGTLAGGSTLPLPGGAGMPAVRTHIVQSGDNFSSLAEKYYGDANLYTLIQKANPKVDSRRLKLGQALFIPERPAQPAQPETRPAPGGATQDLTAGGAEAGIHVVAAGETLAQIAQDVLGRESRWEEIYKLNRELIGGDPARLKVGMKLKLPK